MSGTAGSSGTSSILGNVQVVVTGGNVFAVHTEFDDLYDLYDHTAFAWFDYNQYIPNFTPATVPIATTVLDESQPTPTLGFGAVVISAPTVVPDPRLSMTLSQAQAAVISQLNRIATHQINEQYSVQLQALIERLASPYQSSDKTTMHTYIDGINAAIATKIAAVNALSTVAAVIAFNVWS